MSTFTIISKTETVTKDVARGTKIFSNIVQIKTSPNASITNTKTKRKRSGSFMSSARSRLLKIGSKKITKLTPIPIIPIKMRQLSFTSCQLLQ